MVKERKSILIGIGYSAAVLTGAWLLLWLLGDLAKILLPIFQPQLKITEQIIQALQQLKEVSIVPPLLPGLLIGAGIGLLCRNFCHHKKQRILLAAIGMILFVPFILAALWFTKVNGILLGALLGRLLSGL